MSKSNTVKQASFSLVHRSLGKLGAYDGIMERFRERRGDQHRWNTKDVVAMCHALSYTEDYLELNRAHGNTEQARAIQRTRRILEDEVTNA